MRIGLNLLYLLPGIVGGTEAYATSLIRALAGIDHTNEYILFVNRESANLKFADQSNFRTVACPLPARYRPMRYFWEQAILPWQVLYWRLDVLHSLGYVGPFYLPCRSVVTIHDVNFYAIPEAFTLARRLALSYFVRQSAQRADHILTESQTARQQIIEVLKVPSSKVSVVYGGVRICASARDPAASWPEVAKRYGLRKPYLLAFSSQSPHKNIGRLLEAFAQLRNNHRGEYPYQLVLVGHLPSAGKLLRAIVDELGLNDRVVFTGYVPDKTIPTLYSSAELFISPSLYEGFGLPVLEAAAYGAPVACSNAGSLPEIAGEAAIFFDPTLVEDIADAIDHCLRNPALRAELSAKGKQNLTRFSWEKAARETLKIYNKIVQSHKQEER